MTALPAASLGTHGPDITRLGFGAWAIGHGIRSGVTWVDTAGAYGLGHGEEVVGRAVRELPEDERPYVFTKNGLVWDEGERQPRRGSASSASTCCRSTGPARTARASRRPGARWPSSSTRARCAGSASRTSASSS